MRPRNHNVFINCPFDEEYALLFRAICFTVISCGFAPRSALEVRGSGEHRLQKIQRLVSECDLGIHDISRPRFNMPFELGLYLGCKQWGGARHRRKKFLILDREAHRYQVHFSDLAGHDPQPHHDQVPDAISAVRNWLQETAGMPMRGPLHIGQDFHWLAQDLPELCAEAGLDAGTICFRDLMVCIHTWRRDLARALPC